MIDLLIVKKRFTEVDQNEMVAMTEQSFREEVHYHTEMMTVKRFKNSSLPRDLNKAAQSGSGDIIVICEAGCVLPRGFDDKVIKLFFDRERLGALGCKLVSRTGEVVDAGIEDPLGPQPIWRGLGESRKISALEYEDTNLYLDGKFLLIRRMAYDKFDEEAGKFWAIDFCLSIAKKSWGVVYYPEQIDFFNAFEKNVDTLTQEYKAEQEWFKNKIKLKIDEGLGDVKVTDAIIASR